jgi:serralysin
MADSPTFQGGTAASETLTGTAGMDVIYGQGGADTLIGGDGNDGLYSGEYLIDNGATRPDYIGDRLDGGNGNDLLTGGSGNDFLVGGAGSNRLDGGSGFDTAIFANKRDAYTLASKDGLPAAVIAIGGTGATDTLESIERLSFADVSIAYDFEGNAGKVYRLYQAALNREPDEVGLGWWMLKADKGMSMESIASGFMGSPEWVKLYGADQSNEAFVANLYRNALGREYDQAGFDHWIDHLEHGMSRANVLISFAESAENRANIDLVGNMKDGIEYQLYTTL